MATNLYEAMIVVDAAKGGSEFPGIIRHIGGMLARIGAEPLRFEKWSERKLAYQIERAKRGIYILVYFNAEGAAIDELRRDVGISEDLLRVMVLRVEQMSAVVGDLYSAEGEMIQAAPELPGPAPIPTEAAASPGPAPEPAAEPAAEPVKADEEG